MKLLKLIFIYYIFTFHVFSQQSIDGFLDLSAVDFNQSISSLNGKWSFYKSEFVFPDISKDSFVSYVNVPSLIKLSETINGTGFGTLALTVKLPENHPEILQVRLKRVIDSYNLFINGKLVINNGKPAKNRKDSKPDYSPSSGSFIPDSNILNIVIHFSNFHSPAGGGIFQSIFLGHPDVMITKFNVIILFELLVTGLILMTSLFNLIIYFSNRKNKAPLFLALFCFLMGIRPLFIDNITFYQIIHFIDWEILHKIELLTILLGAPSITAYFHYIYSDKIHKSYIFFFYILGITLSIINIILPAPYFYYTLIIFYIPSLAMFLHVIVSILANFKTEKMKSYYFLAGTIILIITTVNDILNTLGVIETIMLLAYGVFFFILTQTALLAKQLFNLHDLGNLSDVTGIKNQDSKSIPEFTERQKYLESIGVLAGGIAHEFNNLLTIIMGNLFLARQFADDSQIVSSLDEAENAGNKATELANQLLTFSKGGLPVKTKVYVGDFIERFQNKVSAYDHVTFIFNCLKKDLYIYIDEKQFTDALLNIVSNAVESVLTKGQILIETDVQKISYSEKLIQPGEYFILRIKDNGCGIKKENIEKIFNPFFTTKTSKKGLGLSVSYSIIQKHGGTILVDSVEHKGSEFSIYLKLS